MGNRFFTFMVIPERTSRVRKWVVPGSTVRWTLALAVTLLVVGIFTTVMTLRYFARWGEFQESRLKIQYLESELQTLQNKVDSANSTLVRVQNFERKLRVLASLDSQSVTGGIGSISPEDERLYKGATVGQKGRESSRFASVPSEVRYKINSMELSVEDLHANLALREQSLQETYELLKDQESLLSSRPSIWPARGLVTSQFGYRISPFTGLRQLHGGLDIAADSGSLILAPADGVVTFRGTDEGYGKVVVLNHGYGVVTRYGHNSEILVKLSQRVHRGDPIAKVGNTGRATGPHLHYEVRVNGLPVNPYRYILN